MGPTLQSPTREISTASTAPWFGQHPCAFELVALCTIVYLHSIRNGSWMTTPRVGVDSDVAEFVKSIRVLDVLPSCAWCDK
jgi:hypothetical protein